MKKTAIPRNQIIGPQIAKNDFNRFILQKYKEISNFEHGKKQNGIFLFQLWCRHS